MGSLPRCAGYAFLILGFVVSSHSDVVQLNQTNFDQLVIEGEEVWLVEFYAPWCHHCTEFKDKYIEVSTILQDKVKVGAVNSDDSPDLTTKYEVEYLPEFIIFGQDKQNPKHYDGERLVDELVKYSLLHVLPNNGETTQKSQESR